MFSYRNDDLKNFPRRTELGDSKFASIEDRNNRESGRKEKRDEVVNPHRIDPSRQLSFLQENYRFRIGYLPSLSASSLLSFIIRGYRRAIASALVTIMLVTFVVLTQQARITRNRDSLFRSLLSRNWPGRFSTTNFVVKALLFNGEASFVDYYVRKYMDI